LSCLLKEQLLEPALNLTVHCCGLEFRVLNGYDQKSFDEERGLNCVVQTASAFRISTIEPCVGSLSTLPVQELNNFPVGTHLRPIVLKILPVGFQLRQDLGVIVFSCTMEVFFIENLCPVGICLLVPLDAIGLFYRQNLLLSYGILRPYFVQRHEDLTLREHISSPFGAKAVAGSEVSYGNSYKRCAFHIELS
ncbi:hypothetical protein Tco_1322586, partial [Tanacetum coccineum]